MIKIDITGQRFGRWTVIEEAGRDKRLGYFVDLEKAEIARREAETRYWGKRYG